MSYEHKQDSTQPLTNFAAWDVLRTLISEGRPMSAKEIADQVVVNAGAFPRSHSSSCAQLAYELVRRGYAIRSLRRRELYEYAATPAGDAAWKKHTEVR